MTSRDDPEMGTTGSHGEPPDVFVDVRCVSDVGLVRERNEDAYVAIDLSRGGAIVGAGAVRVGPRGIMLAVFDGMGGAAAGDVAARIAAETVAARMPAVAAADVTSMSEALWHAVYAANDAILAAARRNLRSHGMGTTIVGAAIADGHATLVHVGDSRAYLLREGVLTQLTADQSLQNELAAQADDDFADEEYSNIILQAVGVGSEMEPCLAAAELRRDDLLLLCSDGLTDSVSADELRRALQAPATDLAARASSLIELANGRGGHDNATVVLAALTGEGLSRADGAPVKVIPLAPARLQAQRRRRRILRAVVWLVGAVLLALGIAALIAIVGGRGGM